VCKPGVRHREYVYVSKLLSAPEIKTPSILKLIPLAQVCVVSVRA